MSTAPESNHWVEQSILRVGRWFCKLVGILSIGAIGLGCLSLLSGVLYGTMGKPAKPAPVPAVEPLPAIGLDAVRRFSKADYNFDPVGDGTPLPVRDSAFATAAPLRDLFPDSDYAWDDVYQDYCRTSTSYGCLERGRRISKRGVGRFLGLVLDKVGDDARADFVSDLRRILKDAPSPERANLILPTAISSQDRQTKVSKANADHEEAVQAAERKYQSAAADQRSSAELLLMVGGGGIAYGLASMLSVSLVVAILAIERHLRPRSSPGEMRAA